MTKLTPNERKEFKLIIAQDIEAIRRTVVKQIKKHWNKERDELLHLRGLDMKIQRKEEIKNKIAELHQELHDIEIGLCPEPLSVLQIKELGGKVDRWDKARGAHFFGIPVENQLDYDIVQRIKDKFDTKAPANFLYDLARSASREITMAGTFEEAQKCYSKLYSLNFRKYGVDIPPRLEEINTQSVLASDIPLLTEGAKKEGENIGDSTQS